MDLWARDEAINQITVAHELARKEHLEDAGGQTYLAEVIRRLPTSLGAEFYAQIVKRDSTYRGLSTPRRASCRWPTRHPPRSRMSSRSRRTCSSGCGRARASGTSCTSGSSCRHTSTRTSRRSSGASSPPSAPATATSTCFSGDSNGPTWPSLVHARPSVSRASHWGSHAMQACSSARTSPSSRSRCRVNSSPSVCSRRNQGWIAHAFAWGSTPSPRSSASSAPPASSRRRTSGSMTRRCSASQS
jgi:hypothetical protein